MTAMGIIGSQNNSWRWFYLTLRSQVNRIDHNERQGQRNSQRTDPQSMTELVNTTSYHEEQNRWAGNKKPTQLIWSKAIKDV